MICYDVVVIGGGPAGLAAAVSAYENGCRSILLIERDVRLGGILNQCIHNGFGLHTFKEELTGPEYSDRYIRRFNETDIDLMLQTTVLDISEDKIIRAINEKDGLVSISAKAIVLAMGCRERSRGALNIPGTRPAGVFSAGTAQKLVNIDGKMPGKKVVILGSGDIGLIMARRMTLEGAKVLAVVELMPYSGGLKRNIVQCLEDFDIPLYLSHTVTKIEGKNRVEAVTVSQVDSNRTPITGTEVRYECDTLLLSCGLIPENELTTGLGALINKITNGPVVDSELETSIPGVFACGNVLHVHDLVDFVSEEASNAGRNAALYALAEPRYIVKTKIPVKTSSEIRYTVPSAIALTGMNEDIKIRFRVGNIYKYRKVTAYAGDLILGTKIRKVMTPGEMEEIVLPGSKLRDIKGASEIFIKVEDNDL